MYRIALNKTAARSSLRYAAAARASARIVAPRISARSYSSGHSSQQEESTSPTQIITYIAPTVLALAAYYGFIEIPNERAKAAKKKLKEASAAVEESVSEPETPSEISSETETSSATATEPQTLTEDPLPEAAKESIDLLSADIEEAIKEGAIPEDAPVISESETAGSEAAPADESTDAAQAGAFNPETGEINWDCPCLGGMANGPCGEEFKTAFSCFVYSQAEPKGVDCIEKFSAMQDCFRRHPDVYAEELSEAEPYADENNKGIVAAEESSSEIPQPVEVAVETNDETAASAEITKEDN